MKQCALVVADFEVFKIWGLSRTPALLIGMNLLRSFAKVSIDYGRKEIGFGVGQRESTLRILSARRPNGGRRNFMPLMRA